MIGQIRSSAIKNVCTCPLVRLRPDLSLEWQEKFKWYRLKRQRETSIDKYSHLLAPTLKSTIDWVAWQQKSNFFTVMEAGSPGWKCFQCLFPLSPLPVSSHGFSSALVLKFPLPIRTPDWMRHPDDFSYVFKVSVSKYSHLLRYWSLGCQVMHFEGTQLRTSRRIQVEKNKSPTVCLVSKEHVFFEDVTAMWFYTIGMTQ